MTRDEVIEEMCSIMGLAYQSVGEFSKASDGFCSRCPNGIGKTDAHYRNDGGALEFVRQAVVEKLTRDGIKLHPGWSPEGRELVPAELKQGGVTTSITPPASTVDAIFNKVKEITEARTALQNGLASQYLAETGLNPSEVEMVETFPVLGSDVKMITWFFRPKSALAKSVSGPECPACKGTGRVSE